MNVLGKTIIHRKYPDRKWELKAVSIRIDDDGKIKDIIYCKSIDKSSFGKGKSEGVEIYSGRNYIVGSNTPSHSRRYPLNKVPEKYLPIVKKAMDIHKKTKWSKAEYVNKN